MNIPNPIRVDGGSSPARAIPPEPSLLSMERGYHRRRHVNPSSLRRRLTIAVHAFLLSGCLSYNANEPIRYIPKSNVENLFISDSIEIKQDIYIGFPILDIQYLCSERPTCSSRSDSAKVDTGVIRGEFSGYGMTYFISRVGRKWTVRDSASWVY